MFYTPIKYGFSINQSERWVLTYLLLTEFEVRTVSSGPSAGHKSTGKNEDP